MHKVKNRKVIRRLADKSFKNIKSAVAAALYLFSECYYSLCLLLTDYIGLRFLFNLSTIQAMRFFLPASVLASKYARA